MHPDRERGCGGSMIFRHASSFINSDHDEFDFVGV